MVDKITEEFIKALQLTGLTPEEALIYFTLIQHGKKGTYARDLDYHLPIERTTIYSILNRLIEKECVRVAKKSEAPKKAKIFVATSPTVFIDNILREKKQKVKEIEKMRLNFADKLESVFLKNMEYSFEDIDDFLKLYFEPLIVKGWKVIEQLVEKSKINYMFEIYDCTLIVPKAKYIKDCGFLVVKFDYIIENDKNTLNFIINLLKKVGKEQVLTKDIGVKDVKISDSQIEFYNKKYHSFKTKFLWLNTDEYQELTKSVVLPINSKIFFLWAETYEIVKEMVDVIFNVENIQIS